MLISFSAFSHFMWIETNPEGTLNEEQAIKVYFGEYTYGVIEKVDEDAFQMMKNFSLWIIAPNGEKTLISTTAQKNHYLGSFTPSQNGTYTVLLNNNDISVIDYTQYDFGIFKSHYHSMSVIHVGTKTNETSIDNENGLSIKKLVSNNKEVTLQVFYKGEIISDAEVTIFVADQWSKKVTTDANGIISFQLPWKTKYILETTYKEETPGTFKGDSYQFIWHCATHTILN